MFFLNIPTRFGNTCVGTSINNDFHTLFMSYKKDKLKMKKNPDFYLVYWIENLGLEIPIKNQDIIHFVLEKITWSNSNLKMKSLHICSLGK